MSARWRRTPATNALLTAILLGLGFEILTGAWTNGETLARYGAILPMEYLAASGEYWRLLTGMFLHGDGTVGGTLLHILVNVWAIFQLGTLYEIMFGTRRFLLIYFVSGILASITSAMHIDGASVGASGAIFGILGAFVFSVLRSPRWRQEARGIVQQIVFLIIANIIIGLQIPQIDNAAHIGGLVAGLFLGLVWPEPAPPPLPPAQVVVDVRPYDE